MLSTLSVELTVCVLLNLDIKDVLSCRSVSGLDLSITPRSLLKLQGVPFSMRGDHNDPVIQYKIDLAVAGLEDGPPNGIGLAERRERLKRYLQAWRELSPTSWASWKNFPTDMNYGNIYTHWIEDHAGSICVRQLPSELRKVQEEQWIIGGLGFMVTRTVAIPSQDLLVLLEYTDDDEE